MSRVWRFRMYGLVLSAALVVMAVHADRADSARVELALEKWRADSAEYPRRLANWLRDSAVIDSIARTIDDDLLRSLYRTLIRTESPGPITQAIVCEQARLSDRYGSNPAAVVIQRVWAAELGPDSLALRDRLDGRMPTMMVSVDNEVCGELGPLAPAQIGETSLRHETPRPSLPPRPGP